MKVTQRILTVVAIVTLALGILSAPPAADAQQAGKLPRVGFLCPVSGPAGPAIVALQQGLRELGYVEGQNVAIEVRFAEGKPERLPSLAAELTRLPVDVLVPMGPAATRSAKRATSTIPIIMPGAADPVETGLVASIARPGGNITGLSSLSPELAGKRLELLKEVVPALGRVGVFWDPEEPEEAAEWRATELAARALGVGLESLEVPASADPEKVFAVLSKPRVDVLVSLGWIGPAHEGGRRVMKFATTHRLPAIYGRPTIVKAGGLMSYGPNYEELFRRSATYVDKILKGAKPGDLPVEQPTKFELVINLKTAKALGLTIPPSVLIRADKFIE